MKYRTEPLGAQKCGEISRLPGMSTNAKITSTTPTHLVSQQVETSELVAEHVDRRGHLAGSGLETIEQHPAEPGGALSRGFL